MERAHLNSPANAAETRAGSGRAVLRKRVRSKPFDGRRREAKAWLAAFEGAMQRTGGRSEALCRTFASLSVKRVQLDNAVASGADVDVDVLLRVSSELRRTLARLNADAGREPAADDVPLPPDAPAWLVGRRETAEPAG